MHVVVRSSLYGVAALLVVAGICRQIWIMGKVADARGRSSDIGLYNPASLAREPHKTVLLLGDSRLSRWAPDPQSGLAILNRAVGGETVAQLKRRFREELRRFRPAQIVVSSGINDVVGISFMPDAMANATMRTLIEAYDTFAIQTDRAGVRLIITTILPPARPDPIRRFVWPSSTMARLQQANQALRDHPWPSNTMLLDLDRWMARDAEGYLSAEYRLDTLHLNRKGSLRFGDLIIGALNDSGRSTGPGEQP